MTAVKYRIIRRLEMRATRGSEERTTTLTKVEKAGGRKLRRRVEDKGEERRVQRKEGEKSPGQWRDLLSTICRRVSSLPSSLVATRKNPYLPL